jgi:shikimate dehydrogenase
MIDSHTKLCCIIGNPAKHSLSPQMHNVGYEALGLNFVFLAFQSMNIQIALAGLREINARGIAVTIPHKVEALKFVDKIDEAAGNIGATNTILNDNGILTAINTDWISAIRALKKVTDLKGKKCAVLGAGGAARAIIYGLIKEGAQVNIFNRTVEHAKILTEHFPANGFHSLEQTDIISDCDIIINTTSVGMTPDMEKSPIPAKCILPRHVVFDIVYTPLMTKLLKDAKNVGAKIITGEKMLLYGGLKQFELFTGKKAPFTQMKQALQRALQNKEIN